MFTSIPNTHSDNPFLPTITNPSLDDLFLTTQQQDDFYSMYLEQSYARTQNADINQLSNDTLRAHAQELNLPLRIEHTLFP